MVRKTEVGMALRLPVDLHRLLRMYAAEHEMTLKDGVIELLTQGLAKTALRLSTPPWAREPVAPLSPVVGVPGVGRAPPGVPRQDWGAQALNSTVVKPGMDLIEDDINVSKVFPGRVYPPKTVATGMELIEDDEPAQPTVAVVTRVPPPLELATRELAERGGIFAGEYDIPLDWIDDDGHTREENLAADAEEQGTPYYPPPLAPDPAAWAAAFPAEAALQVTAREALNPMAKTTLTITPADIPRILKDTEEFVLPASDLNADIREAQPGNGHARNEEAARAGPITSKDFVVPLTWVARDGVTRAENLKRYGEDEDIEYWPPVKASGLDVNAPIVREEL
jgi:hypothetical protein